MKTKHISTYEIIFKKNRRYSFGNKVVIDRIFTSQFMENIKTEIKDGRKQKI